MLELRTLGTVDLRADGTNLDAILSQPTRMALLVYLAVGRPRGRHRRETLMHLLWPERDEASARAALRQTLHRVRESLRQEVVDGLGGQSVALVPDALWCDAVAFEEALEEGKPAEALALYGGPLLSGFYLSESPEFEHWVEEERARLARLAEHAACSLVEDAERRVSLEEAVRWARRAIELDPYEERNWRRLMALWDRQGERAAAVRAYEELARRLHQELEVEPSPETRATMEAIRDRRTLHPEPLAAVVRHPAAKPSPPGRTMPGARAPPARPLRCRRGSGPQDDSAARASRWWRQALPWRWEVPPPWIAICYRVGAAPPRRPSPHDQSRCCPSPTSVATRTTSISATA